MSDKQREELEEAAKSMAGKLGKGLQGLFGRGESNKIVLSGLIMTVMMAHPNDEPVQKMGHWCIEVITGHRSVAQAQKDILSIFERFEAHNREKEEGENV